jgi:predicted glycosyltransferase
MLIWIDILTPKQLLFLGELGARLEARGHDVVRTTRHYREVSELIEKKGLTVVTIGRHGGPSLVGKLKASARRIVGLANYLVKTEPDLSVAFASPEAARTAYGLGVPHYTVNDSPHSRAVARLTIPLASKLFSPQIIPKRVWVRYGIDPDRVVQYDALDPIAWIKTPPDPSVLSDLGLDADTPIVVFRAEEAFASYLLGRVSQHASVVIPIVTRLKQAGNQIQIVVLPRYREQVTTLSKVLGDDVIVPRSVVDGPSLVAHASVFVGAGGTMTAEAALLGVPTLSCYPNEPTLVDEFLIGMKLVTRVTRPEKAVRMITQLLNEREKVREEQAVRAQTVTSQMEDPVEVIADTIEADFPERRP